MDIDIDPSDKPDPEVQSWLEKLGPGLVTGAADDDPSGIATYSQAGAQFGFNMLWTIIITYPLMVAIQIVSARLGRVSGHGLATNIRRHYPAWLLYGSVVLLLVSNTINIAADLTAMGAAVNLVIGGPMRIHTVAIAFISVLLQLFGSHVSQLCSRTEVVDTRAVRLRGHGVCRPDPVANGAGSYLYSAPVLEKRLRHDGRCCIGYHHQSVPVLLAGFAGGRRDARRIGPACTQECA